MTAFPRLTATNCTVIVVDIQDKLLAKIPRAEELVRNTAFLLDVATLLAVEVLATEQYPKGLGPTTAMIAKRLPPHVPAKTAFSCCGAAGFLGELRKCGRPNVLLVGMETHVCVSQTAFDLREAGFKVFLPVDALACRNATDGEVALRRLEQIGCVPTTVEAVAFEWLGDSTHPHFKTVSKLVVGRDATLS